MKFVRYLHMSTKIFLNFCVITSTDQNMSGCGTSFSTFNTDTLMPSGLPGWNKNIRDICFEDTEAMSMHSGLD
jgi:hypothetical protein